MQPNAARLLIGKFPEYKNVVFPFLIGEDMIGKKNPKPTRYVVDFQGLDVMEAEKYPDAFARIKDRVLPARQAAAAKETERNKAVLAENPKAKVNHHHANFLKRWWLMSYPREDLIKALNNLPRYIVCGRVTKRPIFEFISTDIRPNDACAVFAHADDYTFGILQSDVHWIWFTNRCSTLTERFRYTSNTVFDSFPWPQAPSPKAIRLVADAAKSLRAKRNELLSKHNMSLRELYRSLERPGDHPMKVVHTALDKAVRQAYRMKASEATLEHLLGLNADVAAKEKTGGPVQKPGLPNSIRDPESYISADCLRP